MSESIVSVTTDYFRGWAKPGPRLPEDSHEIAAARSDSESLDAISGHYRIFQLKAGHRFSTDDILTAWYGTSWCPSARSVLDLGSGIGSVGMVAAWRLQGARFVTVEAQPDSVSLSRKSALHNGLGARYEIRQGDFRDPRVLKPDERFDLVLGSPPYFPEGSGIEGEHPQKVACRFELRGSIDDYCQAALRHLAPGGLFACVFPEQQLPRVFLAARSAGHGEGLAIVRRRPIVTREGDPPLLSVFAMCRETDLPATFRRETWVEPPLVIRCQDGRVHPEYSAVKLSIGFPP